MQIAGDTLGVVGVVGGNASLDEQVFLPLAEVQWLTDISGGALEVLVYGPGREARHLEPIVEALRSAAGLGDTEVAAWYQREPWLSVMAMMDGIQGFIQFFIIMLAALAIFNTMSMSVLERTGEIGVLRAMGMSRPRALGLFLVESIFIGLLGSAFGVHITVDQFDDGHRRHVAIAETRFQNAGISTGAVLVAWAQFIEQLGDHFAVAQPGKSHATLVHTVALGHGDERLGDAAQLLGFGQRGLDDFMIQQRHGHVLEHGLAVAAVTVELPSCLAMTHGSDYLLNKWLRVDRIVRLQTGGRPVFQAHPQRKPARCEHVLDLGE